jgi:hypothetical protein
MLRPLVLAHHDEARGEMRQPHGTVGRVDVLPAGSLRPKRVNPQIAQRNMHVAAVRVCMLCVCFFFFFFQKEQGKVFFWFSSMK